MSVEHSQGSAVYLIHSRKCPFKNAAVVSFAGYLQSSNDLKQVSGKENDRSISSVGMIVLDLWCVDV